MTDEQATAAIMHSSPLGWGPHEHQPGLIEQHGRARGPEQPHDFRELLSLPKQPQYPKRLRQWCIDIQSRGQQPELMAQRAAFGEAWEAMSRRPVDFWLAQAAGKVVLRGR